MPQFSLCNMISKCQNTYFKYAIFYNETCMVLFQMYDNNEWLNHVPIKTNLIAFNKSQS